MWWILILLLGVNGLFIYGVIVQVFAGIPFGDKPMSDAGLIFVMLFLFAITFMLLSFRLDTEIKKDGIYVRFSPFHRSPKFFPWESLAKVYVREYSPILEYGGWGIRYGLFGKGNAYNMSGNTGLQLVFNNGKKLLIGTQKQNELEVTLSKLGQIKK